MHIIKQYKQVLTKFISLGRTLSENYFYEQNLMNTYFGLLSSKSLTIPHIFIRNVINVYLMQINV